MLLPADDARDAPTKSAKWLGVCVSALGPAGTWNLSRAQCLPVLTDFSAAVSSLKSTNKCGKECGNLWKFINTIGEWWTQIHTNTQTCWPTMLPQVAVASWVFQLQTCRNSASNLDSPSLGCCSVPTRVATCSLGRRNHGEINHVS